MQNIKYLHKILVLFKNSLQYTSVKFKRSKINPFYLCFKATFKTLTRIFISKIQFFSKCVSNIWSLFFLACHWVAKKQKRARIFVCSEVNSVCGKIPTASKVQPLQVNCFIIHPHFDCVWVVCCIRFGGCEDAKWRADSIGVCIRPQKAASALE